MFSRRSHNTSTYRTLLTAYLRPQWRSALLMTFLLLTSIGLQLLNPQLLRSFIDTALSHGPYNTLMLIGSLFIAISLANQVISVAATYMSERVAWMATNWLRRDLVAHCLALDMSFHNAYSAGTLIERIDGDTETLSDLFSQALVHLGGNLLLLIGIVILLFREDWLLGLTMALFMLLSLFILMRVNAFGVPFWKAHRQQSADFFSFLNEHLEGTEEVRANGATSYVLSRFFAFLRHWLPIRRNAGVTGFALSDVPISSLSLQEVRRHVSMVTQDVQLFRGTVRDNLTFFDSTIPDAHIRDVLQEIGLSRWYAALPHGLDSEIGTGGEGLSAGEAQLLACARVFLTNPGLVILDEASSRLDLVTEQAMERAMKKLLEGRTAIIIAHRLSTVQFADDILILQDGRIVEHGCQKTLRTDPTSRFAQLLTTGLGEELS